MQGLLALAQRTGRALPPDAVRCFEGMDSNRRELKDVPVMLVLPVLEDEEDDDGKSSSEESGSSSGNQGRDLAVLLENWSALS